MSKPEQSVITVRIEPAQPSDERELSLLQWLLQLADEQEEKAQEAA